MSDGKKAEQEFYDELLRFCDYYQWWSHRFPDARTCNGRLPKQPADFAIMHLGHSTLVDVKEIEHGASIPVSRLSQLNKMLRFCGACGNAGFVIKHLGHGCWYYCSAYLAEEVRKTRKSVPFDYMKRYDDVKELIDTEF